MKTLAESAIQNSFKNKAILAPISDDEGHAFVTYRVDRSLHSPDIFEEIAIGQSLGAWDERFVDRTQLEQKVIKIISIVEDANCYRGTLAFPQTLWHGRLSWLLTLMYGKMSFYRGVCLERLSFNSHCFTSERLTGPRVSLSDVRLRTGAPANKPLLMGILKPNVAMSDDAISELYAEVAQAGVHLVKDDEIRHDADFRDTLKRIEKVANRKSKEKLKTLYVAHAPIDRCAYADLKDWSLQLQNAGADALLINVWTVGIQLLQELRSVTTLPLMAHPALAGALGQGFEGDAISPQTSMGSLVRAAGADLTLFPSPYGKIGLPKTAALAIASACKEQWEAQVLSTTPVPSAGIKPEHVEQACGDFGSDFVLNAGTAIFASGRSVAESARDFLGRLEAYRYAL